MHFICRFICSINSLRIEKTVGASLRKSCNILSFTRSQNKHKSNFKSSALECSASSSFPSPFSSVPSLFSGVGSSCSLIAILQSSAVRIFSLAGSSTYSSLMPISNGYGDVRRTGMHARAEHAGRRCIEESQQGLPMHDISLGCTKP